MELTTCQLDVLQEVLAALSLNNAAAPLGEETIYLHELSAFLLCQLYSKEAQRPDTMECWPGDAPTPVVDHLMSPTRTQRSGSGRSVLRAQLQSQFRATWLAARNFGDYLRRSLRSLLELLADAPPPLTDGHMLSAREVDRLAFVISSVEPVSTCVPGLDSAPRRIDQVLVCIRNAWEEGERLERLDRGGSAGGGGGSFLESPRLAPIASMLSPSPRVSRMQGLVGPQGSGHVDEGGVSAVVKNTVVRGQSDLSRKEVRVADCHDSVIYLLGPLQAAYVLCCSDCTVVLGAVGRLLRVEKCDRVQVICAANRVVLSNCHECTFYMGTPRPPCMVGDNRFIRIAPFNTRYAHQLSHAQEVGLRVDLPNQFDAPVVLTGKDRRGQLASPDSPRSFTLSPQTHARSMWTALPPEEFLPFVVPFTGGQGPMAGGPAAPATTRWQQQPVSSQQPPYLFPLPPDYERALHHKCSLMSDMRTQIKQAALGREREREVKDIIHSHFQDWLSSNGLIRQIYDLHALDRDEAAHLPAFHLPDAPRS